LMTLMLKNL
ncbi:hypothetical protein BVZ80_00828B, partial [Haemophilus influenzae]